ncbi:hypothetical protein GCM10023322_77210 [Rugosimonospora acidiphila]|uniref:Uncharacterized protein n=1 Tax=Rugosimonospora acidiphila TaxID=556531 RepID=A0ABP9ST13_9ACTN
MVPGGVRPDPSGGAGERPIDPGAANGCPDRRCGACPELRRSPILHPSRARIHRAATGPGIRLRSMADFLVVLGIVAFVAAMLGVIKALERV